MPCPNHPAVAVGLDRCERCGGIFCPDCFVVVMDAPYCASCKLELIRDLRSGLQPGSLDLGSIGRRLAALWLDGFLTSMASYALLIPLMIAIAGAAGAAAEAATDSGEDPFVGVLGLLVYPIALGIPLVYEGWMLTLRSQTLGKMALGVKVVTPEGGPISTGQAWGRTALKVVFASCMGITYVPALMTRERTCLHDMIAGTRVVRVQA
jgi:uncharacterized RDD family membrane protein YckC